MVITGETGEESMWYIGHKASPFKGDKINIGIFPKCFIHCDTEECDELRANPLVNKFQSRTTIFKATTVTQQTHKSLVNSLFTLPFHFREFLNVV